MPCCGDTICGPICVCIRFRIEASLSAEQGRYSRHPPLTGRADDIQLLALLDVEIFVYGPRSPLYAVVPGF